MQFSGSNPTLLWKTDKGDIVTDSWLTCSHVYSVTRSGQLVYYNITALLKKDEKPPFFWWKTGKFVLNVRLFIDLSSLSNMSDKSELKAELERKKQRIAQIREEKKRKEEEKKKKDVSTKTVLQIYDVLMYYLGIGK